MEKGKIVIVATQNDKVTKYLKRLEKEGEIVVKQAEQSVVDYFEKSQVEIENFKEEQCSSTLMSFLWLDENRNEAKMKHEKLIHRLVEHFEIKGGHEEVVKYKYTVSQIHQATGLSNSEATDLLKMLESFGLVIFMKSHIVHFTVNEEAITEIYKQNIQSISKRLLIELSKYDSFVKSKGKENTLYPNLKENILSILEPKI